LRAAKEYLRLLQSLLPKGKAWNRDEDSTLSGFLYGQAEEFARVDGRSSDLLVERSTLTTNELLTDHENDLGLPDACSNEDETITERRHNAHSKLIQLGQQTSQYYIDIASAMEWTITITEFSPFISGVNSSGDSCGDSEVIFYWLVTIDLSSSNIIYFTSGNSQSGDLLQQINDIDYLICKLNQLKPAHTKIIYEYEGVEFGMGFDTSFDSVPSGSDDHLTGAFNQSFGLGFDVYLGGDFDSGAFDAGFLQPGYGTDIGLPVNLSVNIENDSSATDIDALITRDLLTNFTNLPDIADIKIFISGLIQLIVSLENTSSTADIDVGIDRDLLVDLENTSSTTDIDDSVDVDLLASLTNTSSTTDISFGTTKNLSVNLENDSETTNTDSLITRDLLTNFTNLPDIADIDFSVDIDLLVSLTNTSSATDIDSEITRGLSVNFTNLPDIADVG